MSSENRIKSLPLQIINRNKIVNFEYNGKKISGYDCDTVGSALYSSGMRIFGRSFKYHRPRGLFCVSGNCPNCLMNVDGKPNVRSCTTKITEGMIVKHQNAWPSLNLDFGTSSNIILNRLPVGFYYKMFIRPKWLWPIVQKFIKRITGLGKVNINILEHNEYHHVNDHFDIVILGSGLSGLISALEVSDHDFNVLLVEADSELGGHLKYENSNYNFDGKNQPGNLIVSELIKKLHSKNNVKIIKESNCFGLYEDNLIGISSDKKLLKIRAKKLIIATGSFERPYLFGNNDIPGIFLGSGIHKLVNLYGVNPGNKLLIMTNNSYGYNLAADLLKTGINIVSIVDSRKTVINDDSINEMLSNNKISILSSSIILKALGKKHVKGAIVGKLNDDGDIIQGSEKEIDCDIISLSVGSQPENSLIRQAGVKVKFDNKLNSEILTSSVPNIYAAGESTGISDSEINILQSTIAAKTVCKELYFENKHNLSKKQLTLHENLIKTIKECEVNMEKLITNYKTDDLLINTPLDSDKKIACICEDVSEKDYKLAIMEGYSEMQTLKRYTTFSMGSCQGKMCSVISGELCSKFSDIDFANIGFTTSRPPTRPVEMAVLAGPSYIPYKITPMHASHLKLKADFMEVGDWERPRTYFTVEHEYDAIRKNVGIIDVSTLGRFDVKGKDVAKFIDFVYGHIYSKMKIGKVRYAPLYSEHGMIMDDGVIARLGDNHYLLTSSTGNANAAEQWLNWWKIQTNMDVHINNITAGLAGINVAGPKARQLLTNLVDADLSSENFPYMACVETNVAGINSLIMRIGFVGEASWEIHFPSEYGEFLWNKLLSEGSNLGISVAGVETMRVLSLEKRHFWPTLDTDSTTDGLSAGLEWSTKFEKEDFVGKHYLEKIKSSGIKQQIIGFKIKDDKTASNGDVILYDNKPVGRITTTRYSYHLKQFIGLAWVPVELSNPGNVLEIIHDDKSVECEIVEGAFYDPSGDKMRS